MAKKKIKNLKNRRKKQEKKFTFRNKKEWMSFCDWVSKQQQKKKKQQQEKETDTTEAD